MLRGYASSTFGHMASCCLPLLDVTQTLEENEYRLPSVRPQYFYQHVSQFMWEVLLLVMGTPDHMFK